MGRIDIELLEHIKCVRLFDVCYPALCVPLVRSLSVRAEDEESSRLT